MLETELMYTNGKTASSVPASNVDECGAASEEILTHTTTIEPVDVSTVQSDKTVLGEPYLSVF